MAGGMWVESYLEEEEKEEEVGGDVWIVSYGLSSLG